jgi:hypothetical protein
MKNFLTEVDFTPLKIWFSVLAIVAVSLLSDVLAMTERSALLRPIVLRVSDELKTWTAPRAEDICKHEGKWVNYCQPKDRMEPSQPPLSVNF